MWSEHQTVTRPRRMWRRHAQDQLHSELHTWPPLLRELAPQATPAFHATDILRAMQLLHHQHPVRDVDDAMDDYSWATCKCWERGMHTARYK